MNENEIFEKAMEIEDDVIFVAEEITPAKAKKGYFVGAAIVGVIALTGVAIKKLRKAKKAKEKADAIEETEAEIEAMEDSIEEDNKTEKE